ncbi:hypothetical protein SUGI_0532490 [Cryptomeria japonica]|nr:hypothetical protein SUGI_0532490 [Cryptomeria japonica]
MASTSTSDCQSNAFEEIVPPSASTSAPLQKLPWDIFINHRGPDVKKTLATAIYNALHGMGIRVFLDSEELLLGEFLPAALQEAMQSASLHMAIFSPGYAQSAWCLAELSFMRKSGTPIIPVFYRVQPNDLRWVEKGMYNDAFAKHQEKGRYSPEKLQEWKTALSDVSYRKGEIINDNDDEQRVLKNIVNHVMQKLKIVPLDVAIYPVGLEEVVADFEMTLTESVKAHPNVQVVGIWGMGGSGKTTLARELYNQKCSSAYKSSFLSDIRDAANRSELLKKQMKLLEDLGFDFQGKSFDSIEQGKMILSNYLRSVQVLIILDDIDHTDQLEALLPPKGILGWGSVIIVTTREREILKCSGISSIYKMKTMDPVHAEQLFCWHAFKQSTPLIGFEELVENFLSVCNGLPLSLKVIGGQLYGCSSKDLWEDQLEKFSRILPNDIKNKLRVSYNALDEEEKQMFLDVACFFIGNDKMTAIAVWDGSGWNGLSGWERLINKCLVDFDDGNGIIMHDHLRDLGREIAKTDPPYRLWLPYQIKRFKKPMEIRGIQLNVASNRAYKFPARRYGLKVFVVGENYGEHLHIVKSSIELAWLSCTGIAHINLPSWVPFNNLRVLELHHCKNIVGLWKDGPEAPVELRVLIISGCQNLARIPDSIGHLTNLKRISLSGCQNLARIPNSIGHLKNLKRISLSDCNIVGLPKQFCHLQSLEHLELKSCQMLSSLPSCFGCLTNLRHLDLSSSQQLKMLPDSFKQLTLLQHLDLGFCEMLTLKSDILENMTKVEYLDLSYSTKLEELPRHITNQASLCELYLTETRLRALPSNIGQLSKLRVLKISSDRRCFGQMQSLPESMGSLKLLEQLELENLQIESLPKSLKQLSNLQTLKIINCPITELDFGLRTFTSSLCHLKEVEIARTRVSKISISEDCCPCLTTLTMWNNDNLTEVDTVPATVEAIVVDTCDSLRSISGIGGAANLRELTITSCQELNRLPSFEKLASLKFFVMSGGNKVKKIQGLQHCTSMEVLSCICWEVPRMESLEHMQRLRRLSLVAKKKSAIDDCIQKLQKWPEELVICTMAVPGAWSLLNSTAFRNLSVLHSFANMEITCSRSRFARMPRKRSSNADAIMLCLLINCRSPRMPLLISGQSNILFLTEVDEGKWIWIGVLTQHAGWFIAQDLFISQFGPTGSNLYGNEMEKGFLVRGEEDSVMEAFHSVLALLGKVNSVGRAFHRLLQFFNNENIVVELFHRLFKRLLSILGEEDHVMEAFYLLLAHSRSFPSSAGSSKQR